MTEMDIISDESQMGFIDDVTHFGLCGLEFVESGSPEEVLPLAVQEMTLQQPNTDINSPANDMPPQILFALETFGQALQKCGQSMLNLAHNTQEPGQVAQQLEQTVHIAANYQ